MQKQLLYTALAILALLVLLCFRPISISKSNSLQLQGQVFSISFDEKNHDLNFKIIGDNRFFYINRATEHGLQIKEVVDRIKNRNVTLCYAKHWTPLDLLSSHRHVVELSINDSLIFSEIR